MTRVLIDTSIYVEWIRTRRHADVVGGGHGPPWLSAAVAMEILAGRRDNDRTLKWVDDFRRKGRLLVPSWIVYRRTAHVVRELRREGETTRGLTSDVLIAMTAREAGARLYTLNGRDFRRIAAVEPFDLAVVE